MSENEIANDNLFNYKVTIAAFKELLKLLNKEEQLIKANKIKDIELLIERKNDLAQFFQNQKETLKNNPEIISGLSDAEKNELRELAQKLHEASITNEKEVAKAMLFSEQLIKMVYEIVSRKIGPIKTYNKNGANESKFMRIDPPSVSINDKI